MMISFLRVFRVPCCVDCLSLGRIGFVGGLAALTDYFSVLPLEPWLVLALVMVDTRVALSGVHKTLPLRSWLYVVVLCDLGLAA